MAQETNGMVHVNGAWQEVWASKYEKNLFSQGAFRDTYNKIGDLTSYISGECLYTTYSGGDHVAYYFFQSPIKKMRYACIDVYYTGGHATESSIVARVTENAQTTVPIIEVTKGMTGCTSGRYTLKLDFGQVRHNKCLLIGYRYCTSRTYKIWTDS